MFKNFFIKNPPVTKVSLSANEWASVLEKKYSGLQEKGSVMDRESIRINSLNDIQSMMNLNEQTAKEKYNPESVCLDLYRNHPEMAIYYAKNKIKALLSTPTLSSEKQLAWFTNTLDILQCNNPKVSEFFAALAGQSITNTGGNMISLLCLLANEKWIPQLNLKNKTAKIEAYHHENEIHYRIKIPIQNVLKNDGEMMVEIENANQTPIGFIGMHLKVNDNKNGEPQFRVVYEIESNNEVFRQKIVQPLNNKLQEVRHEAKPSNSKSLENHWDKSHRVK